MEQEDFVVLLRNIRILFCLSLVAHKRKLMTILLVAIARSLWIQAICCWAANWQRFVI